MQSLTSRYTFSTNSNEPLWFRISVASWFTFAALALAASIIGHFLIGLGSNQAQLFNQASRMITPGKIYTDLNPALLHILYLPPLLLSKLHIPQASCLALYTIALEIFSLTLCHRVLRSNRITGRALWLPLTTLAIALNVLSFQHCVFADRDHLALLFIAPWLLLCSPMVRYYSAPSRLRSVIALSAAIGFTLNPTFLVFYLATILLRPNLKKQLRDGEHHIIGLFLVGYVLVTLFFQRDYFTTILPLAWYTYVNTYWPLTTRLAKGMQVMVYGLWTLWLGVIMSSLFPRTVTNPLTLYLGALLLTAFGIYMLNTGWSYTYYPFFALSFTIGVVATSHMLQQCLPPFRGEILPTLAVSLALAACMGMFILFPAINRARADIAAQSAIGHPTGVTMPYGKTPYYIQRHIGPNSRYLFLSTNLHALSIQSHSRQSLGRYDTLWPLPKLVSLRDSENPAHKERFARAWPLFIKGLIDDINEEKPARIIVDASPRQPPMPGGFNMMRFLHRDTGFSQVMRGYGFQQRVNDCTSTQKEACAFEIYFRREQ